MKIVSANPNEPSKTLMYGIEGVGKSTFGANSIEPIFITPEGGTSRLRDRHNQPVKLFEGVSSWDNVLGAVNWLQTNEHKFKTVVLDSADWIEGLAHKKIIGGSNKDIIRVNGGYGAGYRDSQRMHAELIGRLENLRITKGMNMIVLAHYHVKQVKDPEMLEDYDQYEIKCHEFVSGLWREWVDAILFVRFKTFLNNNSDSSKSRAVSDGSRVCYTQKNPAYQAKNRFGLPPEMDFDMNFFNVYNQYASQGIQPETAQAVHADIEELLKKVTDENTRNVAAQSTVAANGDVDQLARIRTRLKEITTTNP